MDRHEFSQKEILDAISCVEEELKKETQPSQINRLNSLLQGLNMELTHFKQKSHLNQTLKLEHFFTQFVTPYQEVPHETTRQPISNLELLKQYNIKVPNQSYTLEELKLFDGQNGYPAYIAVNGLVFDVTQINSWIGGKHAGLKAGQDLTTSFQTCHQNNFQLLFKQATLIALLK